MNAAEPYSRHTREVLTQQTESTCRSKAGGRRTEKLRSFASSNAGLGLGGISSRTRRTTHGRRHTKPRRRTRHRVSAPLGTALDIPLPAELARGHCQLGGACRESRGQGREMPTEPCRGLVMLSRSESKPTKSRWLEFHHGRALSGKRCHVSTGPRKNRGQTRRASLERDAAQVEHPAGWIPS